MVKTLYFQCKGVGSIPGQGTKIPHAVGCGQKGKKTVFQSHSHIPNV